MTDNRMMDLHFGTIKLWNADQGYAIVTPQEGGLDTYVTLDALKTVADTSPGPGVNVIYENGVPLEVLNPFGHRTEGQTVLPQPVCWAVDDPGFLRPFGRRSGWFGGYRAAPESEQDERVDRLAHQVLRQQAEINQIRALLRAPIMPDTGQDNQDPEPGLDSDDQVAGGVWIGAVPGRTPEPDLPAQASGLSWLVDASRAEPEGDRAFCAQAALLAFGKYIRQQRTARDLTLDDLARKAGTSVPQLSLIERGTGKRGPSLDLVARILWALGQRLEFGGGDLDHAAGEQVS